MSVSRIPIIVIFSAGIIVTLFALLHIERIQKQESQFTTLIFKKIAASYHHNKKHHKKLTFDFTKSSTQITGTVQCLGKKYSLRWHFSFTPHSIGQIENYKVEYHRTKLTGNQKTVLYSGGIENWVPLGLTCTEKGAGFQQLIFQPQV